MTMWFPELIEWVLLIFSPHLLIKIPENLKKEKEMASEKNSDLDFSKGATLQRGEDK